MRVLLTAALVAVLLVLGACGDDDESKGIEPIPAAGEFTPSEATPGVPPGSSYDVDGNEWLELESAERFEAAQDYVADHPDECEGAEGTAAADPVRNFTDSSIGADFPLNVPIAELLAEGCAAALQSGPQDLAPDAPSPP